MQHYESAVQGVIEKIKEGTLSLENFEAIILKANHLVTLAREVMSPERLKDFQSVIETRKADSQLYCSLVSDIPRVFEKQIDQQKGMPSKTFII